LFIHPKRREEGWDSVRWENIDEIKHGDHLWRTALLEPKEGRFDRKTDEIKIRLFEDFEINYMELKEPFVLDTEPTWESVEYNFIRHPPVTGIHKWTSLKSSQRILRCLGFRMPHRAMFMINLSDIYKICSSLATNLINKATPEVVRAIKALMQTKSFSSDAKNKGKIDAEARLLLRRTFKRIFKDYRAAVEKSGFTVFEGIMGPGVENTVPGIDYGPDEDEELDSPGRRFQAITEFFENLAPSNVQLKALLKSEIES